MFTFAPWSLPARQRRRFLATRLVAPQALCPEIIRALDHVAAGTCETEGLSVMRGLVVALRGILSKVVAYAVAGRLALLAAVLVSSRIFSGVRGLPAALMISTGYFVFQLLGAFFTSRSDVARGQLAHGAGLYLTSRINRKLLRLGPETDSGLSTGMLKNLVSTDLRYFSEFVSNVAWNLVPALASVVILGPVTFLLAGWPGLIGIAVSFGNVPLAVLFSKKMQRATAGQQVYQDRVATLAGEWLRNVRLSRFLGWQGAFERDIALNVRSFVRALTKRHVIACVTFGISFAWWMVPVVAMLVASQVLASPLDLIGFFSTLWVIKDLGDYLQNLPHTINLHAAAAACLARIDLLEKAPELTSRLVRTEACPLPAAAAYPIAVELRGVRYAFSGGKAAAAGVDLRLTLAERTAVIGEVGCGKTTLLRLLAGELAPQAGEILVTFSDGNTAPLWDERIYHRYRAHLAYVPQEPFISNDTLAANIALAAGVGGPAHLEAAYLAELEADLALLPKGLEGPIGEAGVTLSGGQRQRVSLARAFYARRQYMLLDDPLSAVDGQTETALMEHLCAAQAGFLLVTHRLAELRRVDRVIVVDAGLVVESGTPTSLAADATSRYATLARAGRDD